ncbi:MAG: hypothetical protein IH899_12610 [Planctomycetes bacterium]|nr:hypothetical protein [Planctomycetota bacterium]
MIPAPIALVWDRKKENILRRGIKSIRRASDGNSNLKRPVGAVSGCLLISIQFISGDFVPIRCMLVSDSDGALRFADNFPILLGHTS